MDESSEANVAALTLCELLLSRSEIEQGRSSNVQDISEPSGGTDEMCMYYLEPVATRVTSEVTVATSSDCGGLEHSFTPNDVLPTKPKHHVGQVDISFKRNKRARTTAMCKRRPTLLKKAFELHSMTGADVFCLVQDKTGKRWFYGSGSIRDEFCEGGLQTNKADQEYLVRQAPDRSVVVKPSPNKLQATQTYLPASLQTITPVVREEEKELCKLPTPKGKLRRQKLFHSKTLCAPTPKQVDPYSSESRRKIIQKELSTLSASAAKHTSHRMSKYLLKTKAEPLKAMHVIKQSEIISNNNRV